MFILLTTLLNHDYAIRHVIFYHEWICSRERTRAGNINAVSSTQTVTMSLGPIFIKPIAICRPVRLKSVQFRCFIPMTLQQRRQWLDFTKVPENSELGRQASEYAYMGTLGESYSIIMRLLPPSYRMFQPPAELYDSMIFVTDANPTKILEE